MELSQNFNNSFLWWHFWFSSQVPIGAMGPLQDATLLQKFPTVNSPNFLIENTRNSASFDTLISSRPRSLASYGWNCSKATVAVLSGLALIFYDDTDFTKPLRMRSKNSESWSFRTCRRADNLWSVTMVSTERTVLQSEKEITLAASKV